MVGGFSKNTYASSTAFVNPHNCAPEAIGTFRRSWEAQSTTYFPVFQSPQESFYTGSNLIFELFTRCNISTLLLQHTNEITSIWEHLRRKPFGSG